GLCRWGSWVETTPASSAARTTTARTVEPTAMLRLRAKRRISLIADPRIDDHVERVDREVDEDVGRGGDQDHALHHRVGAAQPRRDDRGPEAGDVEDDLGHHGAADEDRHRDPDDGHDRHERVAKSVDP